MLNEDARKAIFRAMEIAQWYHQPEVDTEHLLQALLDQPEPVITLLLMECGVRQEELQKQIVRVSPRGETQPASGHIGLAQGTEEALVFAHEQARLWQHAEVGVEHLLVGLLREETGRAARVLQQCGLNIQTLGTVARNIRQAAELVIEIPDAQPQSPELSEEPRQTIEKEWRKSIMWQRFTERASKVIYYAQEEAERLWHNEVSAEHLLLGLVRESDVVSARLLDRLGVTEFRIRTKIEESVAKGETKPDKITGLNQQAKRVIDLAYEESRHLNNNYIGTEHLLLGLIRHTETTAARILLELGVNLDRTRREVLQLQNAGGEPEAPITRVLELSEVEGIESEQLAELIQKAYETAAGSSPQGAAVLSEDGTVYTGGNHQAATCAERIAIWNAVSKGVRRIRAIAVIAPYGYVPCGDCLQVMQEFVEKPDEFLIYSTRKSGGAVTVHRLSDLLPHPFRLTRPSRKDAKKRGG